MILKFNKNIYDDPILPVESGSTKAFNYSLAINKDGEQYLIADEYDIQEVIDSYEDQCSIARIIALNGLGDESILDSKPGVYLDEEQVKFANMSLDQAQLNTELFKLYAPYKDKFTFEEFSNAIIHGDFKALDKPVQETKKEEVNNA